MGNPMARNIIASNGKLSIWNRTAERAKPLVNLWATLFESKQELAANIDVLVTMVTAWEDVYEILFGEDGMVATLKKGSVVIDMSTIGMEWAEKIGSELGKLWIHFIDAPVTGSTPKAMTGELTIFVGGDMQVYGRIKPVLDMMGTNIQYMWPIGAGQAMKLVNNTLVAYSMIGLSEVMKLSKTLGLPVSRTAEVIKSLPVSSPYIVMKVNNFVKNEFPMMFSLANMKKDISLAHDEMKKWSEHLPMLDLAKNTYDSWVENGLWDMDVSAIGKL